MIKLKNYFRILNDKVFSAKYLKNLERDEHTLYKLVMDCFNFDPVELTKLRDLGTVSILVLLKEEKTDRKTTKRKFKYFI